MANILKWTNPIVVDNKGADLIASSKQHLSSTFAGEKNILEAADRFLQRQDYVNAFSCYQKLLSTQPNNVHFLQRCIECLSNLNGFSKALNYAKILYSLDPKNTSYLKILVDCLYNFGSYEKAFDFSQYLLELSPENLEYKLTHLKCLVGVSRYDEAISYANDLLKELQPQDLIIREYTLFAKVRALAAKNMNDEALSLLDQVCAMRGDENCSEYLGVRATCLYKKGEFDKSLVIYDRLISDSNSISSHLLSVAFFRKAAIVFNKGNTSEALKLVNRSIKIDKNIDSQILKVDILLNIGNLEQSIKLANRLLKLPLERDDIVKIYYYLGCTYLNMIDFDSADHYFSKILPSDNMYLKSKFEFWDMIIKIGEGKLIKKDLEKHYKKYPEEKIIALYLGVVYKQLRNIPKSIHYLDIYLTHKPNDTIALFNKANSLHQLELLDDALDTYNTLLKIEPNNIYALYQKSIICDQLGEFNYAKIYLEQILAIHPNMFDAILLLGKMNMELGDFQESINNYELALQISTDQNHLDMTYFAMGVLYIRMGDSQKALEYFESMSDDSKKDPDSLLKISQCNINSGHSDKAAFSIKQLYTNHSDDKDVLSQTLLMDAYKEYTIGNYNDALSILNSYLEHPSFIQSDESLVLNNIAICHMLEGNISQGLKIIKQSYKLDPSNLVITTNFNLAFALKEEVEKDDLEFLLIGNND